MLQVIESLVSAGAAWIQVDEPIFALTFSEPEEAEAYTAAFKQAAAALQKAAQAGGHLIFTTYFNTIANNIQIVRDLPEGSKHAKKNYF